MLGGELHLGLHVQPVDGLGTARERIQGGVEPEVVECGGTELGDEVPDAGDLALQAFGDLPDGDVELLGVAGVAGVGELHAQHSEALDGLVVELPRPAFALTLARLRAIAQPCDLGVALRHQLPGEAGAVGAKRGEVLLAEATILAQGDDHPARDLVDHERLHERALGFETELAEPRRLVRQGPLERHRLPRAIERAERAAFYGDHGRRDRSLAAVRLHVQLTAPLEHHDNGRRSERRSRPIGHQLEKPSLATGEHAPRCPSYPPPPDGKPRGTASGRMFGRCVTVANAPAAPRSSTSPATAGSVTARVDGRFPSPAQDRHRLHGQPGGTWFGVVALSLGVLEHTHSDLAVAAVLATPFLPALLAPAVVARVEASPRRGVLSLLYLIEAAALAGMAVLVWHFWLPGILLLVAIDGGVRIRRALCCAAKPRVADLVPRGGLGEHGVGRRAAAIARTPR